LKNACPTLFICYYVLLALAWSKNTKKYNDVLMIERDTLTKSASKMWTLYSDQRENATNAMRFAVSMSKFSHHGVSEDVYNSAAA